MFSYRYGKAFVTSFTKAWLYFIVSVFLRTENEMTVVLRKRITEEKLSFLYYNGKQL